MTFRTSIDRTKLLLGLGTLELRSVMDGDGDVVYRSAVVTESGRGHVIAGFIVVFENGRTFKVSLVGPGTERDACIAAMKAADRIAEFGLASIAFSKFDRFSAVFSEITSEVL